MIRHGKYLGVWTAVWAAFFSRILLGAARLPNSDLTGQFYTFAAHQAREMWAGRLPIWSGGSFGGVPFVADTQAAVFYPPRWVTVLLSGGEMSYYLLELEGLAHVWLLGAGVYLLVRRMVAHRPHAGWVGVVAAVALGVGGYATAYALLQLAVLETYAWLPWALWAIHTAVFAAPGRPRTDPTSARRLIGAGLFLAVAFTAGHPQTFLHIAYTAAAYYLFCGVRAGWHWRTLLGRGAAVMGTAVGAAAAAWLPAVWYVGGTVRAGAGYDFVSGGQALLNYVQLFVPSGLTFWTPEYVGIGVVGLAVAAWAGRNRAAVADHQRAEIVFWAVVAVLAAWLSLGDKGILFALWYEIAPGFSLFRQQERLVNIVVLAVVILGAHGLSLVDVISVQRGWTAAGIGLAAAVVVFTAAPHIAAEGWPGVVAAQVGWLALTAGAVWVWRERPGAGAAVLLIAVVGGDLYTGSWQSVNRVNEPPQVVWPQPDWLEPVLAADGRFDPGFLYFMNMGEAYGIETVRGISPLKPTLLDDFERLPLSVSWPLLNVTHGVFGGDAPADVPATAVRPAPESLIPGEAQPDAILYRHQIEPAWAWLAYEPVVVPTADDAWDALAAPGFAPRRQVVVPEETAALYTVAVPDRSPSVRVDRPYAGTMTITADTAAPGYLVISEWAVDGWQIEVNGESVEPLRVNHGLLGVWLPAGTHTVAVSFAPWVVPVGIGLSLAVVLAAVAAFVRWRPIPQWQRWRWPQAWPGPDVPVAWFRRSFWTTEGTEKGERRWLWGIVFVLLVGFALRGMGIDAQELRGDEAFSFLFADKPLVRIVPDLISEADPHPPLHYLLLGGWMGPAGDSELALRYPSLLAGFLLLPVLAVMGRRVGGRKLGLLTAGLGALSPSLVWLAQDVRNQYTLALLFTAAGTLALWRAIDEDRIRWWVAYGLLAAAAMYSHYYAIFALLAHGAYAWRVARRGGGWRPVWRWALAGAGAAVLFLPWLWVMVFRLAAKQLSDPATPKLAEYLTQIGVELTVRDSYGYAEKRWFFLGAAGLVGAGWGRLRRTRPTLAGLFGGWLLLAVVGIFLVLFRRSTFNPFYIAVAAPAWLLLAAVGVQTLWQRGPGWRWLAVGATAAWVVGMGISLQNYYFNPDHSKTWGYRPLTADLTAQAAPGDLFVAHFPDPAFDYYLRHLEMPRTIAPRRPGMDQAAVEADLRALADEYERLWFVPAHRSVWDRENWAYAWLETKMWRERKYDYRRMSLHGYRPWRRTEAVARPVERALVGDGMTMAGVHVTVNGRPVSAGEPIRVNEGDRLRTTILWAATAGIDTSYTVFVHLLGGDGRLVAQHDGIPVQAARPTNYWQAGERFVDVHEFFVPRTAAGAGELVVGVYTTEGAERRPFDDGREAWPVSALVFE